MSTRYPKPDRSTFQPNFIKTRDNDALDIGWAEGTLSDGRPYRMEYWCQDGLSIVTFFLSTIDLDLDDPSSMRTFLEGEGLVRFLTPDCTPAGGRWADSAGSEMWSLNVVIGDEDNLYADVAPRLQGYDRS